MWPHLSFPVNLFGRCSPSVLLLLHANAQQPFRWLLVTRISIGFFITLSDIWQFNQKEGRYTNTKQSADVRGSAAHPKAVYSYTLIDLPALGSRCRWMQSKAKTLLKNVLCYRGPELFRKSYFQLLPLFRHLSFLFGRSHFNRHFQISSLSKKTQPETLSLTQTNLPSTENLIWWLNIGVGKKGRTVVFCHCKP